MKMNLPDLAYTIMMNDKADKLLIKWKDTVILVGTPNDVFWMAQGCLVVTTVKYANRVYIINVEIEERVSGI